MIPAILVACHARKSTVDVVVNGNRALADSLVSSIRSLLLPAGSALRI